MTYRADPTRYETMQYRYCGRSGLKLPVLSLGLWQNFGAARDHASAMELLGQAFDAGITHFDLANNYGPPPGAAEELMGRILAREFRPYRGYSDADLAALVAAYDQESKASGTRYDAAVERRAHVRTKDDVMGNVREFERAQRVQLAARDARSDYAEARASLEGLRKEQARRAADASELDVFLRHAFSF